MSAERRKVNHYPHAILPMSLSADEWRKVITAVSRTMGREGRADLRPILDKMNDQFLHTPSEVK